MKSTIKTSLFAITAVAITAPAFAYTSGSASPSTQRTAINDCSREAESKEKAEDWSRSFNTCLESKGFKMSMTEQAKQEPVKHITLQSAPFNKTH